MTNVTLDPVGIDGAKLTKLTVWEDERGSFFEAFRASWFAEQRQRWMQWNVSRSTGSVVRGLHFHKLQTDYWHVVAGGGVVWGGGVGAELGVSEVCNVR